MKSIAVALCLLCAVPASASSLIQNATGRFEPTQSKQEVDTVLAQAVDEAASQVTWAFRGLARPKLAEVASACPGYQMRMAEATFAVRCDGRDWFEQPIGGPPFEWTPKDGKTVMVTVTRGSDWLTLRFEGDQGGKSITYQWSDASTMRVKQEIFSGHLSKPMTWSLNYRKQGGGGDGTDG